MVISPVAMFDSDQIIAFLRISVVEMNHRIRQASSTDIKGITQLFHDTTFSQ